MPKTIFTNSASEYWHGDGALVHVDPSTGPDLPEDPDVRAYLLNGTDHFGSLLIKDTLPGANPVHHLDPTPVQRALLIALEQWGREAIEPRPAGCRGRATARPWHERRCSLASAIPAGRIPKCSRLRAVSTTATTSLR